MGQDQDKEDAANSVEASEPLSAETKTQKASKHKRKLVNKAKNHDFANANEATGTTPKSQNKNSRKAKKAKSTPHAQVSNKDEKRGKPENKEKGIINQTTEGNNQSDLKYRERSQSDLKSRKKITNDLKNKENSQSDLKNKVKSWNDVNEKEKSQTDQKISEKLGGLIFMCNRKTKPECFHYMVMGLPSGKKELVMSIKPGLKLFLYDFNLRILYGIYTASSRGGMKLEPAAFNGSFPAQVHFKIHKDCIPLPESVFKKAIKDNYDEKKNKFRMELTVQQVKKLTKLFRPLPRSLSNTHSAPAPVLLPNMPSVPPPASVVLPSHRPIEIPESRREASNQAYNGVLSRDIYPHSEATRYHLPPSDYKREHYSSHDASMHRETVLMQREAIPAHGESKPRELLYLSEKEYRAFGLKPITPAPVSASASAAPAPSLDPYRGGRDPYGNQLYHTAYSGPYQLPLRREMYSAEIADRGADLVRKRGEEMEYDRQLVAQQAAALPAVAYPGHPYRANVAERAYKAHAMTALSDYNRAQQLSGRSDVGSLPVSSRYSFAGPSLSYQ